MVCVGFRSLMLASAASASLACASASAPAVDPGSADEVDTEEQSGSARVSSGGPELPASTVVTELRGYENDFRSCFLENPGARGMVRFRWQISKDGRVTQVEREATTLAAPGAEACLAARLGDLRFESGAATAHWTFVFQLVQAGGRSAGRAPNKRQRMRAAARERGVELAHDSPGFLAAEQVDNVVESGFPLFARCYRDGVSRNAALGGAVRLRFVVDESGEVSTVQDLGSDLTDRQVVDCVAEGFYALRFPAPEHGSAHLLYRIQFDSG